MDLVPLVFHQWLAKAWFTTHTNLDHQHGFKTVTWHNTWNVKYETNNLRGTNSSVDEHSHFYNYIYNSRHQIIYLPLIKDKNNLKLALSKRQFKSLTEHWHNSSLGVQQYQSNKAVHSGGIPGSDQLDVSTSLPLWSLCYWSFMLSTGSTSLLWTCIKPTVKMNKIKNMLDAHTVTAGYYWNDNGSTLCSIVQQKMLT